jgi:adenylate cyclase
LWKNRDRLLDSGKLPWQTVTATVLFTDLKGFSTVSEKMSSQALMVWLNEYLSAMTEEVVKHQGIVNKFTGDGVVAVFGLPVPRKHLKDIARDARNAVACALAMGDRLAELNSQWQERGLPAAQMRVGIFTGLVTAGSLGGKERLEYGVIGDTVNSASRLESCEKHRQDGICRVLIAKETLVYLQGKFKVESWGELKLRGKEKPVEVFLISGYNNPD